MTFRIERDGAGRECIFGELDGRGVALVLEHVMYDRAHGHGWLTNDARTTLQRLSPLQAQMLNWYDAAHDRAAPNIFPGDPVEPNNVEQDEKGQSL